MYAVNGDFSGSVTSTGGFVGDLTGNASSASNVLQNYGTANYNRPLLLTGIQNTTTVTSQTTEVVYSNKFYANPSTGTLNSTGTSGTSSVDGKPAFESALTSSTYKSAYNGGVIINSTAAKGFTMLARMKSTNGKFMHGVFNADYQFYYVADSVTTNTVSKTCLTINEDGTVKAPNGFVGNVTGDCSGSSGSCTGNAATATKLATARNIGISDSDGTNTGTAASFNGTAAVTIKLPATIKASITGNCSGSSGSCTGNAASSTYATNIRVTSTKNNNYYYAVGTSGNTASTNYAPAVFPNIVIRDDTDSTSEAFSRLRLGNATAKGTSGGKTGCLTLYGNNTKLCNLLGPEGASSDFNVRLPNSAGTLALTSSNITGSSASCTGNAASATYATNIRVTDTDSNTWYPLVFSSGSAASTNYAARVDADSILVYPGTSPAANTQGYCYMQLGNAKATATAGNKRGVLRIYGTGTSYTQITSAVASTARSISFPDKAGTVALTSDIPSQADYVIEQTILYGTTYVRGYRKWNSGLLEKWDYVYTATLTQEYAVTFDTTVAFSSIPTVFVTKAHPYIQDIYTTNTFAGAFISVFVPHIVTKTGFKIYISRGTLYNDLNHLQYHALGKWN